MDRCCTVMAALLVALAGVGCTSNDQGRTHGDTTAAGVSASTQTASPNVVTVHAKDYSFQAPDRIPAGMTTFRLVNDGPNFHHMVIARLDSGKTMPDLAKAIQQPGPPPGWVALVGGPNAPDPGREANATLDMMPGNYALLCFVDVPGGVPHVAKGMVHPLTVIGPAPATASTPVTKDTITMADYKFTLSKPLTAGQHMFMVRNTGAQPHEVELIQLAPGKTAQDMLAWINKPQGPPPGHGLGGVAPAGPGMPVYFTADLTPGNYALICFVPDAKDGKPHFVHGMVQTASVS